MNKPTRRWPWAMRSRSNLVRCFLVHSVCFLLLECLHDHSCFFLSFFFNLRIWLGCFCWVIRTCNFHERTLRTFPLLLQLVQKSNGVSKILVIKKYNSCTDNVATWDRRSMIRARAKRTKRCRRKRWTLFRKSSNQPAALFSLHKRRIRTG